MNDVTPNLLGIDERVVLGWLPADKELVLSDLNCRNYSECFGVCDPSFRVTSD